LRDLGSERIRRRLSEAFRFAPDSLASPMSRFVFQVSIREQAGVNSPAPVRPIRPTIPVATNGLHGPRKLAGESGRCRLSSAGRSARAHGRVCGGLPQGHDADAGHEVTTARGSVLRRNIATAVHHDPRCSGSGLFEQE
jgi:hypothetical protein